MQNQHITFIGCGNMGRSLIGGLLGNGFPRENLTAADVEVNQRNITAKRFGIEVLEDNRDAIRASDVVVFAVKPQTLQETINSVNPILKNKKPLVISIAAGVRLDDLANWAGKELAIVRVMPNTPALVQAGAAVLCANTNTSDDQRNTAEGILRSVGITIWIEDESLMDIVTALSGSGPAYFFFVMEAMEKAACQLGLDEKQARLLTLETALGAARMAIESGEDPNTLRRQVTSPGGTTERAIQILEKGGLEKLFHDAIKAACDRSKEIAKSFDNKT